jgi:hypothetical protein
LLLAGTIDLVVTATILRHFSEADATNPLH